MLDRHRPLLDALVARLTSTDAHLSVEARRRILGTQPVEGLAGALAARVQNEPHTMTDETIRAALDGGLTEDEVFECVCTAAVGAGIHRATKALALLARRKGT